MSSRPGVCRRLSTWCLSAYVLCIVLYVCGACFCVECSGCRCEACNRCEVAMLFIGASVTAKFLTNPVPCSVDIVRVALSDFIR